jgi:hypothetical protein
MMVDKLHKKHIYKILPPGEDVDINANKFRQQFMKVFYTLGGFMGRTTEYLSFLY